MLIDWFTLFAQALNFLILIGLMKRFLYKPILAALDQREQFIATELTSAKQKQISAEEMSREFKQKNQQFEEQRTELFNNAVKEAQGEHARLLALARADAAALSLKQQQGLQSEARNLNQAIFQHAQKEVFSLTQKVLLDLAGVTLEERVVETFLQRLRSVGGEEKAGLSTVLTTAADPLIIKTTFDLSPAQRSTIENTLKENFAMESEILFEKSQVQICGIKLIANGHEVAWNIADYLQSMKNGVDQFFKEQSRVVKQGSNDYAS